MRTFVTYPIPTPLQYDHNDKKTSLELQMIFRRGKIDKAHISKLFKKIKNFSQQKYSCGNYGNECTCVL